MAELAGHVYRSAVHALDAIPLDERRDIYVVSFFVYDEEVVPEGFVRWCRGE